MARPAVADQVNLSRRHEERLLREAFQSRGPVPALILTGFLGSGKTTVVNHILRTKGNLRLAVLVNEVGELDVDSQLMNTGQQNAAVGVPTTALSGGCACCELNEDLAASLRQLTEHNMQFDYLVLETSGAADPTPMAVTLLQHGFHLDAVATVVDAEAAHVALAQPTGLAQLAAADLIVINKADLVGLRAMSDLEDRIAALAPHIRMVRTRFGQLPLEAVMDVAQVAPTGATTTTEGASGGSDAVPRKRARLAQEQSRDEVGGREGKHDEDSAHAHHSHTPHHHSPGDIVSVAISEPKLISLRSLQDFVVNHLMAAKGVFRAKGVLWVSERRHHRALFHFHGLHRFETVVAGPWEGPPALQMVIIGSDPSQLDALKATLLGMLASPEPIPALPAQPSAQRAMVPAAGELKELVDGHERFEVVHALCSDALVAFRVVGVPLKGVDAAVTNALFMRAVNSGGRVMVTGEVGMEALFQGSGTEFKSRVELLLIDMDGLEGETSDGSGPNGLACRTWEHMLTSARGVLAASFAHVGGCNCDMGDALRALADAREQAKAAAGVMPVA